MTDRCPVCDRPRCKRYRLERELPSALDRRRAANDLRAEYRKSAADCEAHRVDWRARALKDEEREKRRIDSVCWLFMSNYINDVHNEDCPGDDTCDCYPAAHMSVAVNDPDMMPTDAELQRLRAALDVGEGTP